MKRNLNELKEIAEWLEEKYNQDSEDYSIFEGAKPGVLRYNDHTAVSLWACGAIVCIYDKIYFIGEDDGNWFVRDEEKDQYGYCGFQSSFSIGWTESFVRAMSDLKDYVWKNGKPVYFSGLKKKIVCHYRLDGNNDDKTN